MENSIKEKIEKKLNTLPKLPGVYLMHDKEDNIIYVGKAKILKNRVTQYFRKTNKTVRIQKLVEKIADFEYIITDTESEALILESNLIKKHMPKYNVLLKDDKNYPYIRLDNSKFPYLTISRRKNNKDKFFGPYPNSTLAREMIDITNKMFKLRTCSPFKYRDRPCINYDIKICSGPCIRKITEAEYKENIKDIVKFLNSDFKDIVKILEEEMKIKSLNQEYEEAAKIRDKILRLNKTKEKQKISNFSYKSIDAIGIARDDINIIIEVFEVRDSKMNGRKKFIFNNFKFLEDAEIIQEFIKRYYLSDNFLEKSSLPSKLMIKEEIEEKELIEKTINDMYEMNIKIITPKKGEKLKFVEMAEENAIHELNLLNEKLNLIKELKIVLNLQKLPRKIESYDISHISGTNTVSSMVCIIDGKIDKHKTRRFKLEDITNPDDVLSMKETLLKRLNHTLNGKKGLGELPDLIILDGGINQIHAVEDVLKKLNIKIPVFGLVKTDKHKTNNLIDGNRNIYEVSENLFNLLSNLQDEVHNVAINYHRKKRDDELKKSVLDDIEGIGETLKFRLLKEFKNIENIKNASIEDLIKVQGITTKIANNIKKYI